ncbi:hypothetical protein [Prochlorococcus sp. MIT 1223]|uniref:GHMP family kinase ATP-binding protein n=1 Tax=Prochlorococcus sp. MIT 1223 TaxID=3096217 RepID=UPI002A75C07F|nr:hypothetical protein [Prochlorococcus sp. MIT 1223]
MSFFGGGTDYPSWFKEHSGTVISTTIDKYCYISLRKLPPFFDFKYRVAYSIVENVKDIEDLKHTAVKALIKESKIKEGLEIHCDSDLPARSGIGSSSSFVVGLLNAIYAYKNVKISKSKLALDAIDLEINVLNEVGGYQDQYATSYGGLNIINFPKDSSIEIKPVCISKKRKEDLQSHLLLFFTGISRTSSYISKSLVENFKLKKDYLFKLQDFVKEAEDILFSNLPITDFGSLLDESWKIKKQLSEKISNDHIDLIYQKAIDAGASGGKLLGAGSGGFILLVANPEKHLQIRSALKEYVHVPFEFDSLGSQIIYCEE